MKLDYDLEKGIYALQFFKPGEENPTIVTIDDFVITNNEVPLTLTALD